jgi:hypothetical protein
MKLKIIDLIPMCRLPIGGGLDRGSCCHQPGSRTYGSFTDWYRIIALSALLALIVGCATPNLDSSYQPKPEDAIIVLGMDGAVKIGITPGRSDKETWRFKSGFKNRPLVSVRDGFVVVRLDQTMEGQRYGVYQVDLGGSGLQGKTIYDTPSGVIVVQSYAVPTGKAIATFSAEAGTVTYVGTVAFEWTNAPTTTVEMKDKWDPDGAAEHMQKFYPALAPKLRCLKGIDFRKNGFVIF